MKNGFLKADYVGYLDYQAREELSYIYSEYMNGYKEHFRIGGYKIFLDGSPQAKTAWVGEPYEGTEKCGYPIMSNEDVAEACMQAAKEHIQILAHCNGDRACDQFIDAWHLTFKDMKAEKREESDIRPVIVHAQMITKEQLKKVKECCMIPSFFVSHVYYWGDVHVENLGCKRAKEISPLEEAVNLNIPFSIHTDAPVIEPNQLEAVWCAVNRITKKGVPLGIKQCIDVYDALKAVTIDAAYQYHEENRKGSIAPGKIADFVILDKNPLEVEKSQIRNIRVLETIKEGTSVFRI